MSCTCPDSSLESYRAYQYLVLVELLLTICALALSIATATGLV